MSDCLWPQGLQALQASLSFTISQSLLTLICTKSVMPSNHLIFCSPFYSYPQIFPALGSFPMSWLFASGGPSIVASALASVLPMNIQSWFPLGLTGLISLLFKRLSKSLLQHHSSKASILWQSSSLDHHKEGWAPKNWCFQPLKVFSLGV